MVLPTIAFNLYSTPLQVVRRKVRRSPKMSDQQADQSPGVSTETGDQLADVSSDLQALQFGMDYAGEDAPQVHNT